MHEEEYLIVDPACEVNERGPRDKNDGNEVVYECDLPLDLELTARAEVDAKIFHMQKKTGTGQSKQKLIKEHSLTFHSPWRHGRARKEGRNKKKYNPYGEDFVIDRIVSSDLMD